MKHLYLSFTFLVVFKTTFAQTTQSDSYLAWSSTRKLTASDFIIKTSNLQTSPSFAQFYMDFQVGGFDFMAKNFNKKVHNYLIKSASWLDTTYNTDSSIKYQQTLFDIAEIYTRRFRKELKENKKKILSGTSFIKEINAKIMTDFPQRRIEYDTDTKFGADPAKQKQWEGQIQMELLELKNFTNE